MQNSNLSQKILVWSKLSNHHIIIIVFLVLLFKAFELYTFEIHHTILIYFYNFVKPSIQIL